MMNDDLKTVEGNSDSIDLIDPICTKQNEDVAKMRASLLVCSDSATSVKQAINNITILRVYHQIARIIKYTEMCDRIENKLYESLGYSIDNADITDQACWAALLAAQERLQKIMIDSHKLLEPYLNMQNFAAVELSETTNQAAQSTASQLDMSTRDKIRTTAQKVLAELESSQEDDTDNVGSE